MNVYKARIPAGSTTAGILIIAANTRAEVHQKVATYYKQHGASDGARSVICTKLANTEYAGKLPRVLAAFFSPG